VPQKPIEGISFVQRPFRGLYHDGRMASAIAFVPWQPIRKGFDPDKQQRQLYDMTRDFPRPMIWPKKIRKNFASYTK
jgi:hypothetical protein